MEGQKSLFSFVKKTSESDLPHRSRSNSDTTDDIDRPSTSLETENQRSSDEVRSSDKATKKRNFQKGWLMQYPLI